LDVAVIKGEIKRPYIKRKQYKKHEDELVGGGSYRNLAIIYNTTKRLIDTTD
jgi:hypothetical protein